MKQNNDEHVAACVGKDAQVVQMGVLFELRDGPALCHAKSSGANMRKLGNRVLDEGQASVLEHGTSGLPRRF